MKNHYKAEDYCRYDALKELIEEHAGAVGTEEVFLVMWAVLSQSGRLTKEQESALRSWTVGATAV